MKMAIPYSLYGSLRQKKKKNNLSTVCKWDVSLTFKCHQDDGTGRVYVVGARAAAGLILTVASEVFEESGRTLVRGTLDYLQGLKVCLISSSTVTMLRQT